MADDVQDNPAESRYELRTDAGVAVADYIRQGDVLIITHTGTPPALRGQGIASRLVKAMLSDVRRRGLKIMPLCSFVDAYIERHPEERDLVEDSGEA